MPRCTSASRFPVPVLLPILCLVLFQTSSLDSFHLEFELLKHVPDLVSFDFGFSAVGDQLLLLRLQGPMPFIVDLALDEADPILHLDYASMSASSA